MTDEESLKMYGENDAYMRYVNKYAICYGLSVDVALKHEIVKQYGLWLKGRCK